MNEVLLWLLYGIPLLAVLGVYLRRQQIRERLSSAALRKSEQSGMTEPFSLHPVIDPNICVGSGACVRVCPEKTLGIVKGKAHMVNPTVCIGHGACAAVCPVDAIKLVFGTARRGIEIPYVKPSFETNVGGIFIAGELGGMGLIRKAAEQGRQAMETISRNRAENGDLDVVIVGVGPAGLSATLGAMEKNLRFITLEQENSIGGTVFRYPRNKIVATVPVVLPIVGKVPLGEISKESLLELWQGIVKRVDMPVSFGECVHKIALGEGGYVVMTARGQYRSRSVLLALGRRGTPRKLGVPGEELPKVLYALIDPEQYRGTRMLVVGGGDSAIEAALAVASEPGTHVTLSYRSEAFGRIKTKNRERLAQMEGNPQLDVLLRSNVTRIDATHVILERDGKSITLENDWVIVCAGGVLPTPMLKEIGVTVETKFGTA